MKKIPMFAVLFIASLATAQTYAPSQGFCTLGGQQVAVQGLLSTTLVQASYPSCTVTVYLTGTTNKATIYSDTSGTALGNPTTATINGSWIFYSATGVGVDVVLSGGVPIPFPSPFTLTGLMPGGNISQILTVTSLPASCLYTLGQEVMLVDIANGRATAYFCDASNQWSLPGANGKYLVDGYLYSSVESAINSCIASTNTACEIDATTSGLYGTAADVIWSNMGAKLDPMGKSITLYLGAYNNYISQNSIVTTTGLTIVGRSGVLPSNNTTHGTAITFPNATADAFVLSTDSRYVHPQNVRFQNFTMYGAGTGTQNGLSFDCTAVAGGIDASLFENLAIRNFAGDAIHLPCSKYNGGGNNQNTIFSNIQAYRVPNSGGYALYLSGNSGNLMFLHGHYKPDPLIAPGICDSGTTVYIGGNNLPVAPATITSFSASNGILAATYANAPVAVTNQTIFTLSGFTSGYGITNLNGQVATILTVTGQSGAVPPYSGTITATLGVTPPDTTTITDTGSGAFNNGTFNPNSIHFIGTTIEDGGTLVNLNGASNIDFIGTHFEGCSNTNGFLFTLGGSQNRTINMVGGLFLAVGKTASTGYIFNTNASGTGLALNVGDTNFGSATNVVIGGSNNQAINIDHTNNYSGTGATSGVTPGAVATTSTAGNLALPTMKDISVQGGGAITSLSGGFMPTQPFTLRQTGTWKIYQTSQTASAAIGTTYACTNNVCAVGLQNQIPDPGVGGTITSVDAPVNGQTVYHGTFPSIWIANSPGLNVDIIGLSNSGNNGNFPVTNMTATTLIVTNSGGVAETHAGNSYLETEFVKGAGFTVSCAGFVGNSFPVVAATPTSISVFTGAVSGSGTCGAAGGAFTLNTNINLGGLPSVSPSNAQAVMMRLNDITGKYECANCGVVGNTVTSPFSFVASTVAGGANYASATGVLYTPLLPDGVTSGNATCSQWGVNTGLFDPTTGLPTMKASMLCEDSLNPGLYLWQTDKAILAGNMLVPISGSSWTSGWNVQYNSASAFESTGRLTLTASGTTVTTAGTIISAGTCQAQTPVTIAGVTTASVVPWSIPTALPATWQTGIHVVPVVTANTVTLNLCNPTAGSITPAAQAVNIRVIQ